MRIVGGEFRSRRLVTLEGQDTRPTADKVREALFNILQGRVYGARVLDLYAGSGAISLEAISRGAAFAAMNDKSRDACRIIRQNITALGCEEKTALTNLPDSAAIAALARSGEAFDLCFLDPPYKMNAAPVAESIYASGLMKQQGLLIIEHAWETPPAVPRGLRPVSVRRYGNTGLSLFEAADEAGKGERQ